MHPPHLKHLGEPDHPRQEPEHSRRGTAAMRRPLTRLPDAPFLPDGYLIRAQQDHFDVAGRAAAHRTAPRTPCPAQHDDDGHQFPLPASRLSVLPTDVWRRHLLLGEDRHSPGGAPGLSGCPRQHPDLVTEPDRETPARCRSE